MANDEIIKEAVRLAQAKAAEDGLRLGQTVAHPDEPITCELLTVDGETATIGWKELKRTFPLRELFDPNVANGIALEIQGRQIHGALVAAAPLN